MIGGAVVGGLVATAGALGFGWLITISIPVGVGTAILADQLLWRRIRRRLEGEARGLLANLKHLLRDEPPVDSVGEATHDHES